MFSLKAFLLPYNHIFYDEVYVVAVLKSYVCTYSLKEILLSCFWVVWLIKTQKLLKPFNEVKLSNNTHRTTVKKDSNLKKKIFSHKAN